MALGASMQSYFLSRKPENIGKREYVEKYNNYNIFKQSFNHLINKQDLYVYYPKEYHDFYKYSPSFAVLMAPFSILPDIFGLTLWNILNALLLFLAIKLLPIKETKHKSYILWFVLIELITSIQSEQSNGIIVGLIILSFVFMERKNILIASLFIVLTVYIKLFGIVAFALFLFYPDKGKFIGFSLMWAILIGLLPLIAISIEQYVFLHERWFELLSRDHTISNGLSVLGWLNSWFGLTINKLFVLASGVILFCLPLVKFKSYIDFEFRMLTLSSILIWIIIFNHMAESTTFVIAITGAAIWYFTQKRNTLNLILICLAFVFASISPTDIFPKFVRENYVIPYVLKAVPLIFIWFVIIYQMMFDKFRFKEEIENY